MPVLERALRLGRRVVGDVLFGERDARAFHSARRVRAVEARLKRVPDADGSAASGPAIASSTSGAVSALRAIGPILSSVHESAIAPWRETSPYVGRRPVTPQYATGVPIEPDVSRPERERDDAHRRRPRLSHSTSHRTSARCSTDCGPGPAATRWGSDSRRRPRARPSRASPRAPRPPSQRAIAVASSSKT